MGRLKIHFVTGRLAEYALRKTLASLGEQAGFDYSIDVLPITVAALMTPQWIMRHICVPPDAERIIIPGYCEGDLQELQQLANLPVDRGPRDLRDLPEYFGEENRRSESYGEYDIEIIAEINHAPRLSLSEILDEADRLASDGADVIDVGCDPGDAWGGAADCVKALRDRGLRVSIDSLNPKEIAPAARAGAELVLSVNASNRDAAAEWGCEVVAIPDEIATLGGLADTVEMLDRRGVPFRIDPILEPIGLGFAASLERYIRARRDYPDAEMMMGIGNLTELTDADSAPINVVLLGICQELAIRSVLTTQVIGWARTCVKECDLARRLVHFAVQHRAPPKRLEPRLVMLRDVKVRQHGSEQLARLAEEIRDNNYRVFVDEGQIHLISSGLHIEGDDPFLMFDQLISEKPKNVDASHAFYLGYEMAKAAVARVLGKDYRQDESLDWGLLTVPEQSHRLKRKSARKSSGG